MAHEDSVELLEAMDGLDGGQIEPYLGHVPKGAREHSALGDIGYVIKVQSGLDI